MPNNQKLKIFGALLSVVALSVGFVNLPPIQVSAQDANLSMTLCKTVIGADTFVDTTINIKSSTGDYILAFGSVSFNYEATALTKTGPTISGINVPEILKDSTNKPVSKFDAANNTAYSDSAIQPLDLTWMSYETIINPANFSSGTMVTSTAKKYGGFRLKATNTSKNHGIRFDDNGFIAIQSRNSGGSPLSISHTTVDPTNGPISALPVCNATTLGTVAGTGGLTGTIGSPVSGTVPLNSATYTGPAEYRNGSCVIPGTVSGSVFTPQSGFLIPATCPTGAITSGSLVATPTSGSTPDPITNEVPSNFTPNARDLTVDDLKYSDLACISVTAGDPTNCTFTMPTGKVLPTGGLYFSGGNVTTGGSCIEMMGLVMCLNVPTQGTADPAAPIMVSLGSTGSGQDTNKDVNLTTPTTSTTLGTPTGTGGITGAIGSPVSGTVPLNGATYTGPAEYRNGSCVIPGTVSGSVFTPQSGFLIPDTCPTGAITSGSLAATPTSGFIPDPITNEVPSNFSPALIPVCYPLITAANCGPSVLQNLTCAPTMAGSPTTCTFNPAPGYTIPNDLKFGVGDVTPGGTCVISGSTVFCTNVPTQTTAGTGVPIYVSRPSQTPHDTTKKTDLYSTTIGSTCTPEIPCFLPDTKYSFNPVAGTTVYGTRDAVLTINPSILTGTPNSGNKYVCKVSIKMAGKADTDIQYGYAALTPKLSGGAMFGSGVDTAKIIDYNNTTGNCSFTLPKGEQSARYYDYRIIVAEVDGSNNNVRQVFQTQPGYYMKLGSFPVISVYS